MVADLIIISDTSGTQEIIRTPVAVSPNFTDPSVIFPVMPLDTLTEVEHIAYDPVDELVFLTDEDVHTVATMGIDGGNYTEIADLNTITDNSKYIV